MKDAGKVNYSQLRTLPANWTALRKPHPADFCPGLSFPPPWGASRPQFPPPPGPWGSELTPKSLNRQIHVGPRPGVADGPSTIVTHSVLPRPNHCLQFSSVAQSCPTLCDLKDCSTPGFLVRHQLPELAQTHVHRVGDAMQPCHPLSSPSPPAINIFQHQVFFLMSQLFASSGQSIGASASSSVLPMNMQG